MLSYKFPFHKFPLATPPKKLQLANFFWDIHDNMADGSMLVYAHVVFNPFQLQYCKKLNNLS